MEQQLQAAAGSSGSGSGSCGVHQATLAPTLPSQPCCPLCDPHTSKHFHLAYDLKSATPVFKGR